MTAKAFVLESFVGQAVLSLELGHMLRIYTREGWQLDLEGEVDVTPAGSGPNHLAKGETLSG